MVYFLDLLIGWCLSIFKGKCECEKWTLKNIWLIFHILSSLKMSITYFKNLIEVRKAWKYPKISPQHFCWMLIFQLLLYFDSLIDYLLITEIFFPCMSEGNQNQLWRHQWAFGLEKTTQLSCLWMVFGLCVSRTIECESFLFLFLFFFV